MSSSCLKRRDICVIKEKLEFITDPVLPRAILRYRLESKANFFVLLQIARHKKKYQFPFWDIRFKT